MISKGIEFQRAHDKDLQAYLRACGSQVLRELAVLSSDEIERNHPACTARLVRQDGREDILEFLRELIGWIEDEDAIGPLRTAEIASARQLAQTYSLIEHLRDWVERVFWSLKANQPHARGALNIGEFCKSVLKAVHGFACTTQGVFESDGHISWLMVSPKTKEAVIFYNKAKIRASTNTPTQVQYRTEKALLHELGHARRQMDYYVERIKQGDPLDGVWARAHHEQDAWDYAYGVLQSVSSIRARLHHILGRGDCEWAWPSG